MAVSISFDGEKLGTIPDEAMPGFRLYCEQQGLRSDWLQGAKRLELYSYVNRYNLLITESSFSNGGKSLSEMLRDSLAAQGFTMLQDKDCSNERDLSISIDQSQGTAGDARLNIEHLPELDIKLRNLLHKELRHESIGVTFTRLQAKRPGMPLLTITLPVMKENQACFIERIASGLVNAIHRYFAGKSAIAPAYYLPVAYKKTLIKSLIETKQGSPRQQDLNPKDETKVKSEPIQNSESAVLAPNPAPARRLEAEVFFDYSVFPPQTGSEEQEFLITGNFNIKNTGTENLKNPIICIRTSPVNGVGFSGQIIPPNMVDTIGVQGQSGSKGWKYVYEDWMRRVKTKGEYWITPIQELYIPPGETESLRNFQVVLQPQAENKNIAIDGFVYFNEGQDRFISNNRIAFSF